MPRTAYVTAHTLLRAKELMSELFNTDRPSSLTQSDIDPCSYHAIFPDGDRAEIMVDSRAQTGLKIYEG